MKTLQRFTAGQPDVPMVTTWALSELAEAKGKQELYTRQSPQKLKALREHALIESTVSSNRIEGVEVERDRIKPVIMGRALLRDRAEEEVRGYRNALQSIHEKYRSLDVSTVEIRRLHRCCRAGIRDAGKWKEKDGDIIEKYPDGRERVRFRTVSARETASAMNELTDLWGTTLENRQVHPLLALAAFNLDFLCIHPFRDGNGRVSRLLLLLQLYHLGYEAGRYISIERTIEQNKDRYYETLEESSQGWHESKHNPWPYTNYLLFVLQAVYREFEERLGQLGEPRGEKSARVESAIHGFAPGVFRVGDIQRVAPGVSVDLIRRVLKVMKRRGEIRCLTRGRDATWENVN